MSSEEVETPGAGARDGLLLRGARVLDGGVVDVHLRGGRIEAVGEPGTLPPAADTVDLDGYLLLPAPAEPHAHLDTALVGERVPNPAGDLRGAVQAWERYQAAITDEDAIERATQAALLGLSHGTTAIRSHVSIYPGIGLRSVERLLRAREALGDLVDLQLVALTTQATGPDNAVNRDLLREALRMGVDVVGGCPHLDPDPRANHELVLSLATEFGLPVDVHTDEDLDPAALHLPDLADQVLRTGFAHGVTAGHCVSLGVQAPEVAKQVANTVAAAGIAVVCNPQTNLYLQARGQTQAPPRGLTAVRALLDAGVTLAGGGDNVRDPFNAVGRADPLETASLLVTAGHLTVKEAYTAVSAGARAAMGLPEVKVEPGYPAELLAVAAGSLGEAVAGGASRVVIHRGRVVARTTVTREYPTRLPENDRPT